MRLSGQPTGDGIRCQLYEDYRWALTSLGKDIVVFRHPLLINIPIKVTARYSQGMTGLVISIHNEDDFMEEAPWIGHIATFSLVATTPAEAEHLRRCSIYSFRDNSRNGEDNMVIILPRGV